MPDTNCSRVVAMVRDIVNQSLIDNPVDNSDGHEPSEGNIQQSVSNLRSKEYPRHDDHWLHSCSQFVFIGKP